MSENKIFLDVATATVFYDGALDTLFLEYKRPVKNHDEFVEINSELLKAFQSLNTNKMIADIRKMGIIGLDSQNYVINTLIPGMMQHLNGETLYHAQFLDPEEVFAKVSAKNIQQKSADPIKGFVVKQFSDRQEMEGWLHSV